MPSSKEAYGGLVAGYDAPAEGADVVTPHDTNELTHYSRALYVGGAGNLTVVMRSDESASGGVLFTSVPAGTILPIRVKLVKATGTAATNIVALY